MTYFEIHRMHREGLSVRHISNYLVLNRRTVIKYLNMSEQEYESFLIHQSDRKKILLPYEDFVRERLEKFKDTSAAQMHDWLGYYGLICATYFGRMMPVITIQKVPVYAVFD